MNKNIEAAAVEYALDKISVKCPACGMDSLWNNHSNDFKSGAEWALREAIEILGNEYDENKLSLKFESKQAACDALDIAIQKLEQLLSNEDKNDQT